MLFVGSPEGNPFNDPRSYRFKNPQTEAGNRPSPAFHIRVTQSHSLQGKGVWWWWRPTDMAILSGSIRNGKIDMSKNITGIFCTGITSNHWPEIYSKCWLLTLNNHQFVYSPVNYVQLVYPLILQSTISMNPSMSKMEPHFFQPTGGVTWDQRCTFTHIGSNGELSVEFSMKPSGKLTENHGKSLFFNG